MVEGIGCNEEKKRLTFLNLSLTKARRLSDTAIFQPLEERAQIQDLRQNRAQTGIVTGGVAAISVAPVITIVISALEAFAEIMVIFGLIHVVAIKAVIRILVSIGVSIVEPPTIFSVRLPSEESLFIPVVHGLPQQIRRILVYFVIAAAAIVAITRSRIKIRVGVIIIVTGILEP